MKRIYFTIFFLAMFGTAQPQVMVTTFAGSGDKGSADGVASVADFFSPYGLAADAFGNVYVADTYNNKIRKISPSGMVSTLAGNGAQGSIDGPGTIASFHLPQGVAVDAFGNVYVADGGNNKIRKISPYGMVSTLAGSGVQGSANGAGAIASFYYPGGVAVDASGNVYVADTENNMIRKISPAGIVTTLAGSGNPGSTDGSGAAASFDWPIGLGLDAIGNVYVADYYNHKVRMVSPAGIVSSLAGSGYGNTNGAASAASFHGPNAIAIDVAKNLYVADAYNYEIRKIDFEGIVSTLAGTGKQGNTDGGPGEATFSFPTGVAIDVLGNVYVADAFNNKIRKISPPGTVTAIDVVQGTLIQDISVYPNPATDKVSISKLETGIWNISLLDFIGNKLFSLSMSENEYSFNIAQYPKGTYVILINTANKTTSRKLVLK